MLENQKRLTITLKQYYANNINVNYNIHYLQENCSWTVEFLLKLYV